MAGNLYNLFITASFRFRVGNRSIKDGDLGRVKGGRSPAKRTLYGA